MRCLLRAVGLSWLLFAGSACSLIPQVAHQPSIHNPFPQLSRVAIAPFINLSTEPTVDGRQFALAYFDQLQNVPGFIVVPVGTVETAMQSYKISLDNPEQVRRLAQILGVDAVVVGAVTDYSAYYPPRVAMQVDWYAANPCFNPIPAGTGCHGAHAKREFIPAPLVMEAEMALAKAQLKTQTPEYRPMPVPPPTPVPPGDLPADPGAMPLPGGDLSSAEAQSRLVKKACATSDAMGAAGPDGCRTGADGTIGTGSSRELARPARLHTAGTMCHSWPMATHRTSL